MNIHATYFTVIFAMLLMDRIFLFLKGLIWIPIMLLTMFVIVKIVDKKEPGLKLDYKTFSRMKIYDCMKDDATLLK